ncbi:MAG: nucleotide-diphospho-sugar transferase [Pyrinomonadaceae bacterium]|nr:nucleotide-diphospho-sugar transferase [Pyrinomonadaceae bacterium]
MNKTATLVVLAAGIGSRYGGLKQLDPISESGETFIDFSLYDAARSGFSKAVFVIRKSILDEFRAVFDKKLKGKIEVEYVFQETDLIPKEFFPTARVKPWGTGHALLMARNAVEGNFCVINADDFYGRSAFEKMFRKLQEIDPVTADFSMIGYKLENTLSENGSVSRGQCFVSPDENLEKIVERTKILRENGKIIYVDDDGSERSLDPGTIVSMNFWGFTPKIFDHLESEFTSFLNANSADPSAEFYIPTVVDRSISSSGATVSVLLSDSKWLGMTYKNDKPLAAARIKELQERKIYPSKLW